MADLCGVLKTFHHELRGSSDFDRAEFELRKGGRKLGGAPALSQTPPLYENTKCRMPQPDLNKMKLSC